MTAPKSNTLERKLARYALAGTAVLGSSLTCQAGIIYSGVLNQDVPVVAGDGSLPVDFDGLGTDFTLLVHGSSSPYATSVTGPGTTFFVASGGKPDSLNFGDLISTANTFEPGDVLLAWTEPATPGGGWTKTGNWGNIGPSTTAYLGVKFDATDGTHLGWAQLTVSGSAGTETTPGTASARLIDFAYQTNLADTPGGSIAAGQTVPEPSTLALFALGAAGLLAFRRMRKGKA